MKYLVTALLLSASLAQPALALELIPGSIGYGGGSAALSRSPPGTVVMHEFSDGYGRDVHEIYRVESNGSLRLQSRRYSNND